MQLATLMAEPKTDVKKFIGMNGGKQKGSMVLKGKFPPCSIYY